MVNCELKFVLLHSFSSKRTRSLKDRITDSGSVGHGSIPCGCTSGNFQAASYARRARIAFSTASTVTPTSANTAIHMVATPTAANTSTASLMPMDSQTF